MKRLRLEAAVSLIERLPHQLAMEALAVRHAAAPK